MGNSCGIVSRQLSHSKTQQATDNRFTCNRYIIANDMGYPTVTSLRTTWDIERYLLLHARSVHDVEATAMAGDNCNTKPLAKSHTKHKNHTSRIVVLTSTATTWHPLTQLLRSDHHHRRRLPQTNSGKLRLFSPSARPFQQASTKFSLCGNLVGSPSSTSRLAQF